MNDVDDLLLDLDKLGIGTYLILKGLPKTTYYSFTEVVNRKMYEDGDRNSLLLNDYITEEEEKRGYISIPVRPYTTIKIIANHAQYKVLDLSIPVGITKIYVKVLLAPNDAPTDKHSTIEIENHEALDEWRGNHKKWHYYH